MSRQDRAGRYPLDGQKRIAFWLIIPAAGLAASTGLLWWRYGADVFTQMAAAALAMCF